ncbi:MAG TPA: IPT/TIG domain-containing protein [Hymenobacter sp.]|jgi:hypothetical protein|uniref:IPT/TIG domain-containing protein n=1 Tax=Hymenobacter sp. TaxID=1898978 RepID=UPI002EDA1C5E
MELFLHFYARGAAFAASRYTKSRDWLATARPLYVFPAVWLLGLLMSFQGMAQNNINLATTIASTPATGGTAVGGTTVSFSATTTNPSALNAFNAVQQQILITNVSAALYATLTFSAPTNTSITHAGTTVTVAFPRADLPVTPDRTETVSFTVPNNVSQVTIAAAASSNETGDDTDPTPGNNNGTAANAQSSITLRAAAPTITSFTPANGPYTGGTLVTVTGTNFVSGGTTATLAGQTVTVTVVSATQFTFTTPPRAVGTTGPIVVTTNGGTDTSDSSFTYLGTATITGNIFEDPNYGGGAGRPLGTAGTAAVGTAGNAATAATVELYTSAGGYVATTTSSTTAGTVGQYTFRNLSTGNYLVRVVNSTVRSTRPGSVAGLLPVQTFRTTASGATNDVNRVGGEAPQLQDAAAYIPGTRPVTLAFAGLNTAGDQTVFIDNITLNNGGAYANSSFETPALGTGTNAFAYGPAGASWSFGGTPGSGSGIAANGSAFNPALTTAGTQVAFVQNEGSFEQTANLTPGTTYTLTLLASQRTLNGRQNVRGSINIGGTTTVLTFSGGPVSGGNIAPTSNVAYATYTATFTVPVVGASVLASLTQGDFTPQSLAPVDLPADNSAVAGINFGYNFSTIVNSNDTGQGSLAQFITNANALTNANLAQVGQLAGREVSIFMIPDGFAHSGLRAGLPSGLTGAAGSARALIQLSSVLPTLTDGRTRIDGTTQTANIGDSNAGVLGTGGTVGVRGVPLAQINRPEIEIASNTSLAYALDLEGDSLGVRGIAIHGGNLRAGYTTAARNVQIIGNLIGITALAVADPAGTAYNPEYGVGIRGASFGVVRNNLIGYAGSSGLGYSGGANTAGLLVTRNEFVQNGYRQTGGDAISIGDQAESGPVTITFNLITTSNSDGLQFDIGRVGLGGINVVRNNTFFDNGNGSTSLSRAQLEGAAILYLQRTGNRTGTNADSIVFNRIYQTQASGIVVGYGQRGIIITRNSTFGNGTSRNSATGGNLGIDLIPRSNYYVGAPNALGNGLGALDYGNGDGVTPNDGTLNTAFANAGMDYPVFTLTRYNTAQSITVAGHVGSAPNQTAFGGATIDLYLANSLDNNNDGPTIAGDGTTVPHGEGQTYLTTITADANGNFNATITAPASLTFSTSGQALTATAYLSSSGTSEFATNSELEATVVSGYVFEDANYGGGAGRSRATLGSGAVGRPGATVEIYDATNALVGTATTDANGQYSFNVASGNYTVRTVVPTVTSARANGTTASPAPLAVQTYVRNDVNRVGGQDPAAAADSPAAATVGATLTFVGQNPSGLDNTAFVDNVEILKAGVPLATNSIANQSFETPGVGSGFQYGPFTAGWVFPAGGTGVAGNGGGFFPNTTTGTQAAFIQGDGSSFEQNIQLPAGTYSVRFNTAQRVANGRVNNQTIIVRLNGAEIGQITPSSNAYASFTTSEFSVRGSALANVPGNSQVPLTVSTTSITDVDFGYNFNVVTNTNDTGQGSLRQFIANSNALGGESALAQQYTNAAGATTNLTAGKESSIFMVPGPAAVPGLRAGLTNRLNANGVAVFAPATATNGAFVITGNNTVIDGTTQSRNSNTNAALLGTSTTVGTAGTSLAQRSGPEVQIVGVPGTTGSEFGLTLSGAGNGVQGISILGFGNSGATGTGNAGGANIYVTGAATSDIAISNNVIGTAATTFPTNGTDPNTATTRSTGNGILLAGLNTGNVSATISNNLIGYNGNSGIQNLAMASTSSILIQGNEIRNNALLNSTADGVRLGANGGTVQANLITANRGSGVDFDGSAGNILVTGNTISGNGTATGATETSGVRAYGQANTVSLNVITNNVGDGVVVRPGTNTANVAGSTVITRNSILTNGKLGIDLLNTGDDETAGTVGLNDTGDVDGRTNGASAVGANGLLNFPVIAQARISNGNLLVRGYARPGATVELFLVGTADATGFGEGQTFMASAVEGNTVASNGLIDENNQTGLYFGVINGRNQGTDNTNIFVFTIPLASLPAGVAVNALVSATATFAGVGTSEFSGVVAISTGPLPVELTAFAAQAVQNRDAQLTWRTASEKNNDHFDVERSLNGTDFATIGAVKGHGTTSAAADYAWTDAAVAAKANGAVYYRLKQVDADGTATYSPVRTVAFTQEAAAKTPVIRVYPNPATTLNATKLDLTTLPAGAYQVSLLDATGRVVLGASLQAGMAHPLDLNTVASGTYTVLVRGQNGGKVVNLTARLIKE